LLYKTLCAEHSSIYNNYKYCTSSTVCALFCILIGWATRRIPAPIGRVAKTRSRHKNYKFCEPERMYNKLYLNTKIHFRAKWSSIASVKNFEILLCVIDRLIPLLSFQLKSSSNIDSIHYLRLTNSFDQVPRDIHTLPVKEPIPSIWSFLVTSFLFMIG
jgi:hypothetical protein